MHPGRHAITGNISVNASQPWRVLGSSCQMVRQLTDKLAATLCDTGTPACVLCMECISPGHRQECLCHPGFPARRAEGEDNSRRLLLAGWNLLCTVNDRKDFNLIRLDVIDDSMGHFKDLPNLWDGKFRDFPA